MTEGRYAITRRTDLEACNSQVADDIVKQAFEEMVEKDVQAGSDDAAVIFRVTFEDETTGLTSTRKNEILKSAAARVRSFVTHLHWERQQ